MIRSALFFCAGIIAATCFACSPSPPQSTALRPAGAAATCDSSVFIGKIQVLPNYAGNANNYDPTMDGGGYVPPPARSSQNAFNPTISSNMTNDLTNAFNAAPTRVQGYLCALTAVFINPSDCEQGSFTAQQYSCVSASGTLDPGEEFTGAWGFRSHQSSSSDYRSTYIAISAALWDQGASAWPISVYEGSILECLVQNIGAPGWASSSTASGSSGSASAACPTSPSRRRRGLRSASSSSTANVPVIIAGSEVILPANPNPNNTDSSTMTVLAALAHELGHVRWAIVNVSQAGQGYNFAALQSCGANPINFFQGWNYQRPTQLEAPNRWRAFASQNNEEGGITDHLNAPRLSDFQNSANPNVLLYELYQADQNNQPSQPWASFFGAYSPEEDFVETYVLYALLDNKFANSNYNGPYPYLASLPLAIPGIAGSGTNQVADVPGELLANGKSGLAAKIHCLESL
jgi:hypothetical protein